MSKPATNLDLSWWKDDNQRNALLSSGFSFGTKPLPKPPSFTFCTKQQVSLKLYIILYIGFNY